MSFDRPAHTAALRLRVSEAWILLQNRAVELMLTHAPNQGGHNVLTLRARQCPHRTMGHLISDAFGH
jgi:hypothetical protein